MNKNLKILHEEYMNFNIFSNNYREYLKNFLNKNYFLKLGYPKNSKISHIFKKFVIFIIL